jgi:hypothetical protein
VAMTFEHRLPGGSTLRPQVDWTRRSKFCNNSFNTPGIAKPGCHLPSAVLVDAVQAFEDAYNRGWEWLLTASFKY